MTDERMDRRARALLRRLARRITPHSARLRRATTEGNAPVLADITLDAAGNRGRVLLDGVDVSSAITGVTVQGVAGRPPRLSLDLAVKFETSTLATHGALEPSNGAHVLVDVDHVRIPHATRAALLRLGWHPPTDETAELPRPRQSWVDVPIPQLDHQANPSLGPRMAAPRCTTPIGAHQHSEACRVETTRALARDDDARPLHPVVNNPYRTDPPVCGDREHRHAGRCEIYARRP